MVNNSTSRNMSNMTQTRISWKNCIIRNVFSFEASNVKSKQMREITIHELNVWIDLGRKKNYILN